MLALTALGFLSVVFWPPWDPSRPPSFFEPGWWVSARTQTTMEAFARSEIERFAWFGVATASGLLLGLRCSRLAPRLNLGRVARAPWLPLLLAATFVGLACEVLGRVHFGGCDQVVGIAAAWRLYAGQVPYRDFICTLPIGYLALPGLAFRWLGPSFLSLVHLTAAVSWLTCLWSGWLLTRLGMSARKAALLSLAQQALTTVVCAFWWYNPVTSAAAWVMLLSAFVWLRHPRSVPLWVGFVVSQSLLSLTKPNIAALLLVTVNLVLLSSRAVRWRALLAALFGAALSLLLLRAIGVAPWDVAQSYLSIAGRAQPSWDAWRAPPSDTLYAWLWFALALSPLAFRFALAPRGRPSELPPPLPWRELALLLCGAAAGLFAALAHGEMKLLETPWLLLLAVGMNGGFVVKTAAPPSPFQRSTSRVWLIYTIALALVGLTVGGTRHRIARIGYGAYFEADVSKTQQHLPFFDGLLSGARFQDLEQELSELTLQYEGRPLYFGTRLEWAYAAFQLPSPAQLPLALWHRDTFHPAPSEEAIFRRLTQSEFALLIFLRNDFTHYPTRFFELANEHYEVHVEDYGRYPNLTLLHPRSKRPY